MLQSLTIQNIVLIDKLHLEFQNGLCALTGETGAGKSILLDSLSLIVGAKADTKLIRAGEDKAFVTASFLLHKSNPLFTYLTDMDLDIDETEIIVRRVLQADGRSKAYINDIPISVAVLKDVGTFLIDIHGQNDNRGLLDVSTHLLILDNFIGGSSDISLKWNEWQTSLSEYKNAQKQADLAQQQEDFIRDSYNDLKELDPKVGEEEQLAQKKEHLRFREQLIQSYQDTLEFLSSADQDIGQAWRSIDKQTQKAGQVGEHILKSLDRCQAELQESLSVVQTAFADLQDDDTNLEVVDDRLYELRGQARRHHCLVDDLPGKYDEFKRALEQLDGHNDHLNILKDKCKKARKSYEKSARDLSQKRQKMGKILDEKIMSELKPLKLDKAIFKTVIDEVDESQWGINGLNKVRFEVATNPGSLPGPLHKVASGGEMARIMLAIQVALINQEEDESHISMIFDEVDAGIGGSTADAVGARLSRLGQSRQVMVVTHSPQVAARANHHMIVMKEINTSSDTTRTNVVYLSNDNERREEIARMLAGAKISDEARAAASQLLNAS